MHVSLVALRDCKRHGALPIMIRWLMAVPSVCALEPAQAPTLAPVMVHDPPPPRKPPSPSACGGSPK